MAPDGPGAPLLQVSHLSKTYTRRRWFSPGTAADPVLDGVDVSVQAGQTVAITGKSGAGKTTLARCIAGLETPDSGEIRFERQRLSSLSARELRQVRRRLQMVPQDASASLNPRFQAGQAIEEPLLVHRAGNRTERRARSMELLAAVSLPVGLAEMRCRELSSGQRARVAIARALALRPSLLILDESLAGLDFSLQAQMVHLLLDLQRQYGLAYLLIAHDSRLIARMAHRTMVLEHGRLLATEGAPVC